MQLWGGCVHSEPSSFETFLGNPWPSWRIPRLPGDSRAFLEVRRKAVHFTLGRRVDSKIEAGISIMRSRGFTLISASGHRERHPDIHRQTHTHTHTRLILPFTVIQVAR